MEHRRTGLKHWIVHLTWITWIEWFGEHRFVGNPWELWLGVLGSHIRLLVGYLKIYLTNIIWTKYRFAKPFKFIFIIFEKQQQQQIHKEIDNLCQYEAHWLCWGGWDTAWDLCCWVWMDKYQKSLSCPLINRWESGIKERILSREFFFKENIYNIQ